MMVKWAVKALYERTLEGKIAADKIKTDNKRKFEDELAVVAIAKNEARYICEWISYHKKIGVNRIILYDNDSEDGLKNKVQKYIDSGYVRYIRFPGKNQQCPAYNDAIRKFGECTRYMAFIDCDEFIVPHKDVNVSDIVSSLMVKNPNGAGLGVNWALYGSSGYEKAQNGAVTQVFLKRAEDFAWQNFHVKTIANPRFVKEYISPHFPIYHWDFWSIDSKGNRQRLWYNHDVDFSVIRCNHYFCKSREEFIAKQSRGMVDRQEKYNMSRFDEYDLNDVYDPIMLRYADRITY
ncbi:MAG: glycosyltransferase family 2 protein [Clostridiales bacterium]|nr:glycosyltransferase family 2 protein [Clostridiales bacterium]